jgi:predicted ATP-dependent endonuclease of OLD family
MASTSLRPALKRLQIKGFKSIQDIDVSFELGLNIFIGKNGSGKSIFLEALYECLAYSRPTYKYSLVEFYPIEDSVLIWESKRVTQMTDPNEAPNRHRIQEKLLHNGKLVFETNLKNTEPFEFLGKPVLPVRDVRTTLRTLGFSLYPTFVQFNIFSPLDCFDSPGTMKLAINAEDDDYGDFNTFDFLMDLLWGVEYYFYGHREELKKMDQKILLKRLKFKPQLLSNLRKYTPIQGIKFNENINIYKNDKFVTIENIKVDFKINNQWVPWSQLSDGTKRLFYIVADVTNQASGFVLVEEPELGIHPHQLTLLMEFLKNQSTTKQIFVTTHSPQALNCLEIEELSHILVVKLEPKKGTRIRPLTKAEMTKAKKYMNEVGFFSDYWMLSDLDD